MTDSETRKAKHTPGPWEIDKDDPLSITQIEWGGIGVAHDCAQVFRESRRAYRAQREVDEANARLMAAAPELLEACRAAMASLEEYAHVMPGLLRHKRCEIAQDQLIAAIAAAEGRQ